MTMRDEFQRRAQESVQFSQWAGTSRDRKLFLQIANAWRGFASVEDSVQSEASDDVPSEASVIGRSAVESQGPKIIKLR